MTKFKSDSFRGDDVLGFVLVSSNKDEPTRTISREIFTQMSELNKLLMCSAVLYNSLTESVTLA